MEVEFWSHLDRLRLKIYETAGRPYAVALLKLPLLKRASLLEQHAIRLETAERLLPKCPVREHGLDPLLAEARSATLLGLDPTLAHYLPEIQLHFANLFV